MGPDQGTANSSRTEASPTDYRLLRGEGSTPTCRRGFQALLAGLVADVSSSSFAFVMATGIVSIAVFRLGRAEIAEMLFAINLIAFAGLWLLALFKLAWRPRAVLEELRDFRAGTGFLAISAATSVIGNQFVVVASNRQVAAVLWICASATWVSITYGFFVVRTTAPVKPPLATALDGSWLLNTVATEALAILGTHVAGAFPRPEVVIYASLCLFLSGGALYLVIITLILYRWLFLSMPAEQLAPPYWINMGGAAIATLAGTQLLSASQSDRIAAELAPAIATATLLFWAMATWWIPLLAMLMIWRHLINRIPPSYGVEQWSMVFPLGMYTAATWALSQHDGAQFLAAIPYGFVWIALLAWLLTFFGMTRHLSRRVFEPDFRTPSRTS